MTIIHPEKMCDIINTMLGIYLRQGKLPVWHLMGCETDCMVGNPAIPVVADAMLKGFGGFDRALAYEAMRTSAMLDERGLDYYKEYGYIPFDKYGESVATTLEYALADWALAQVAAADGHTEDFEYFDARSRAYRHFFDAETGFLRGRDSHGRWREPFDPFASTHREDDYTEGNAWQYTWLVPHDVEGLAAEFGGMEAFHGKLDSLFVVSGDLGADASPDISGLIGQYAHGNEPSHHAIYLYSMTGEPAKAATLTRRVLNEMYHDTPDGLCGNEDVGQMSAWYVLSALGFYQVEPAGGRYFFGSPIVDEAEVMVGSGKTFTIRALGNSTENKYIRRVMLNGREHSKPFIDFADIAAGGELLFEMGDTPAKWY
jgi:predicted alpha-1,2-mannosidase